MKKTKSITKAVAQRKVPLEIPDDEAGLRSLVATLADSTKPAGDRFQAMQNLQAASFSSIAFDAVRGDYVTALRSVATAQDPQLRQTALGTLAQEGDAFAQKALVDGLKDEKKALLPAAHALQMLSYNTHAGVQSVARDLFAKSKDTAVRTHALRLMAADPEAAPVIQKALKNKKEPVEIRQMSAEALHALDPQALQAWAAKAVQDDTEHEELVTTGLTAMNTFGSHAALQANKPLAARLAKLSKAKGVAKHVKQLALTMSAKLERK